MAAPQLSSKVYQPPNRQVRGPPLKTIIEEIRESPIGDNERARATQASLNAQRRRKPSSSPLRQRVDFDDLYDVTEDEDLSDSCTSLSSRENSVASKSSATSTASSASRNKYPRIRIPSVTPWWKGSARKKNSSVPPTPPPKIPVSPEALSRLPPYAPALHGPPSLDGSLGSDQRSTMSAPATPDLLSLPDVDWDEQSVRVHPDAEMNNGVDLPICTEGEVGIEAAPEDWSRVLGRFPKIPSADLGDVSPTLPAVAESEYLSSPSSSGRGVQLPSGALATLRHIGCEDYFELDSDNEFREMKEVLFSSNRPKSLGGSIPASAGTVFTPLSIPSPGGFFSSLNNEARHTWCLSTQPPSSTTAENFYNCPWNNSTGEVVEQVIECGDDDGTEGPPTAKACIDGPPTAIRIPQSPGGSSGTLTRSGYRGGERPMDGVTEYDEHYEQELKVQASANLGRTSVWLTAQSSYLSAILETSPVSEAEASPDPSPVNRAEKAVPLNRSDSVSASVFPGKETLFYRAFQHLAKQSHPRDTFLHSNFRFEAVQAARRASIEKHVDHLVGKYEMSSPQRPPYRGPFLQSPRNSKQPEILQEQMKFMKVEKEQDVLNQLNTSMWAIDALKFLNGGSLIPSPAAKRLSKATTPLGSAESAGKRRFRVLDLGGHPSCDWAWHVATEYRNVKVYTVVSKKQVRNPGLRGPPNHREVAVPHLWKLPFPDNHFDVISARSLYALLKSERPAGEDKDEYDLCLRECNRCLKPGGFLEFLVMDSEIARAGPYGSATSVEFGFNLKTRGYDPAPTKPFLSRLRKADYVGMKRAWLFLPMGAAPSESQLPCGSPSESGEPLGTTADVASMTGLLGGWMWEQWMLNLQMEMGRDRGKLLEEMASIFDEGRKFGAGWRVLSGWAMKPKPKARRVPAGANDTVRSGG